MVLDPLRRKTTGEAQVEAARRRAEVEKAKGAAADRPAESAPAAGESISVSDKAQIMHRVMRAMAEIADIRTDLVAEIKARIERDEYHVPGEAIAEKVIREAIKEIKAYRNT